MKETRNYYTPNYTDHTTYGGEIHDYDFWGYNGMGNITVRILSDIKFDNMCKANIENRKRKQEYKKGIING